MIELQMMVIDELRTYRVVNRATLYVKQQNKQFQLPTVRQLAKRYRMSQGKILTLIEDADDLDYNVAIATGSAMVDYDNIGDYTVEFCGDI